MPPTFVYAMCFAAYLLAMMVALVVCALLFLVPSQRRLALQLCLATLGSLPGVLVFQVVIGIPLGLLLAAVLGFYAAVHPPDSVQWLIGIPTIIIMFVSFTAASLAGCYTGGRIGWQLGAGTPLRSAVSDQKIFRWISSLRKQRPNQAMQSSNVIEIVPFASQHVEGVGALIVGIQRDEFEIPITSEDQPDLQNIPAFYQQGAGNFWVAVSEGEVVGTVALLDLGNCQGALRKMFVHASYRGPGRGVSTSLLDTLLEWARARGVKDVYLGTTEKFLAAHRFYERNGFQQIVANELPPSFPKMAVDTRFYRRAL